MSKHICIYNSNTSYSLHKVYYRTLNLLLDMMNDDNLIDVYERLRGVGEAKVAGGV